jgi:ABC-type lipoprotein release transport system permease subunit
MSFRDLFGYLSADRLAELKEIQRDNGAKAVTRENAEADLFGGDDAKVVADATAGSIDTDAQFSGESRKLRQEDLINRVYQQSEIDTGVVLNAAIMLDDPKRTEETINRINTLAAEKHWGIKAINWQDASGILGKMIGVFRLLLYVGVGFIILIALIVIFGAMVMATLQRTQTIGTMRAIGAQRDFVLQMVLIESVVLGVVFGGLGIVAAIAAMTGLHFAGIAAPNDIAYFFFSGPRLYPDYAGSNLAFAFMLVLIVTLLSTLIPALMASRISPLRAMQADE